MSEFDQQKHPEIQRGEMWLTNGSSTSGWMFRFKTWRMGSVAYSWAGEKVPDERPFFVSKNEYRKKQAEKDMRPYRGG